MKTAKITNQINRVKYADAKLALRAGDLDKAAAAFERHFSKPANEQDSELAAKFGSVLMRLERYEDALTAYRRAQSLDPRNPGLNYRVGYLLERTKKFELAYDYYSRAIEEDGTNPEYHYRRARVSNELGNRNNAVADVESAIALQSDDSRYHQLLRGVSFVLPLWRQIEILESGLPIHREDSSWVRSLARATFKMRRWQQSLEMSELALTLKHPEWQDAIFAAAAANELDDPRYEAFANQAVELSKESRARTFGAGHLFENLGFRELAIREYSTYLLQNSNPTAYFSRGLLYSRQHRWRQAESDFRTAVGLDPSNSDHHYRLGLSLERQGEFSEAAHAYRASITTASLTDYRRYRALYCYERAGEFSSGLDLIINIDGNDVSESEIAVDESHHHNESSGLDTEYLIAQLEHAAQLLGGSRDAMALGSLARNFARVGRHKTSLAFYRRAISCAIGHAPTLYARAAQVAAHCELLDEAAELYRESRIFQRPSNVDISKLLKSTEDQRSAKFVEFTETRRLDPKLALFEPNHGKTLSGNVIPVLREMMARSDCKDFRFIVVYDGSERPTDLIADSRVCFVRRDSDAYIRDLATAGTLVTDNTFPPYFYRRREQKYLNTWHGTPMKSLGKNIRGGQFDHRNAARNLLHVTHLASPNEFTADVLLKDNDVAHIFTGKVAVTGSPRIDETISVLSDPTAQRDVRERLGLSESDTKIIFFAPTWRGDLKNRDVDIDSLSDTLRILSRRENCEVLFRGHPMDEDALNGAQFDSVRLAPPDVSTNEILGVTDLLVTDYSSVLFDFLPVGRPAVIYAYDLSDYDSDRGFSVRPSAVCGNVGHEPEELEALLEDFSEGRLQAKWNDSLRDGILEAEDGRAAKRTVDFLLGTAGSDYRIVDFSSSRKTNELLFYQGSFMPNGITASFLSLAKHLCASDTGVTVILEPGALYSDEQRVERFKSLDDRARALGRVGAQSVTAEERWVIDRFNTVHRFESDEMEDIYWQAFAREAHRLFGSSHFDAAVCFEGYARFWMALVAGTSADTHGAYLHNDMIGEAKTRFPYLYGVAQQYARYDTLASVSDSVNEANRIELPKVSEVSTSAFVAVPNMVDADRVRSLADDDLRHDVCEWISEDRFTFVNSARLSPEKGQAKLMEALKILVDDGLNVELIIVGQGPLRESLAMHRNSLELQDRVFFTDYMANPFPVVKAADAFVLSSDYEGQGLVLLEALALGKTVLSTDIVGPRSILDKSAGFLVQNDVASLAGGMKKLVRGWTAEHRFSFEDYLDETIKAFTQAFAIRM